MPSSTSSSGYWSWSAPSDQSNPSTPSPPLSADSFKPFRMSSQPDDSIDEVETSSLLFDEPIPGGAPGGELGPRLRAGLLCRARTGIPLAMARPEWLLARGHCIRHSK